MTPTQFAALENQLGEIKAAQTAMLVKLDAALLQQARHDEQIKVLTRGVGGSFALFLSVCGYWIKSKLHL